MAKGVNFPNVAVQISVEQEGLTVLVHKDSKVTNVRSPRSLPNFAIAHLVRIP